MADKLYVGIDVGGTKISAGLVNREGKVLARLKSKTPKGSTPKQVLAAIFDIVENLLDDNSVSIRSVAGIGLGVPGLLDKKREHILASPNMTTAGLALVPLLKKKFKVKVAADNDVNVGVLGECWLGAAKGLKDVVGIFPGTGVGGGVIANGSLYIGSHGAAAEVGHMMVDPNGPVCTCGNKGCLEAVAGRWAIERDLRLAVKKGRKTVITKLSKDGLKTVKSGVIAQALKKKDKLTCEIMTKAALSLGAAAVSMRHFMDPEMIILGGGLIEACGFFVMPIVKKTFEGDRYFPKKGCRIVHSALGDDSIILGAVALVREDDPSSPGYPKIFQAEPGLVTIDDRSYSKDLYVRADTKVREFTGLLSKATDGTKHKVTAKELKKICKKKPDILIIGAGRSGCLKMSPAAEAFLQREHVSYRVLPAPQAVKLYNSTKKRKAILLHLSC